jgi:hypothetical protein
MASKINKELYNKYPQEFADFYEPILSLKKIISYSDKKIKEIMGLKEFKCLIQKYMVAYYSTFIISDLMLKNKNDLKIQKVLHVRKLLEEVLAQEDLIITKDFISTISSYVDFVGKEINTINREYVYMSFYAGQINYRIYELIHNDLVINNYRYLVIMSDSLLVKWKQVYSYFNNKLSTVPVPFYK